MTDRAVSTKFDISSTEVTEYGPVTKLKFLPDDGAVAYSRYEYLNHLLSRGIEQAVKEFNAYRPEGSDKAGLPAQPEEIFSSLLCVVLDLLDYDEKRMELFVRCLRSLQREYVRGEGQMTKRAFLTLPYPVHPDISLRCELLRSP